MTDTNQISTRHLPSGYKGVIDEINHGFFLQRKTLKITIHVTVIAECSLRPVHTILYGHVNMHLNFTSQPRPCCPINVPHMLVVYDSNKAEKSFGLHEQAAQPLETRVLH